MLSVKSIFNVILPSLLIALLFVTPFIVSDQLYNGIIVAKEFWFFGVVAGMLLYSGIQLIFKKGILKISLNITDILLLAFYAWCFIRAIFTPYTPFWHNHKLQVLTGMMVVYFFVKSAIKNEENENNEKIENGNPHIISFSHFFILSFVLSGFFLAIYGLLQLYGIYPSHHNLFKITGSFFNPAPYALYLAVVFPVALGRVLFNNAESNVTENISIPAVSNTFRKIILKFSNFLIFKFSYYLSFATVIAILLVLPATMIRTSWVGAIAGSLVVLQYKYHYLQHVKQFLSSPFRRIMAVLLTLAVTALLGGGVYFLKKDSANGKLFIWEVTLGKIAEKPFFGHGLGRFEAEYNNWQAEYFQNHPEEMDGPKGYVAGNTKYAFNEFLEMASEIGIIGLLLFIAVIGSILFFIPSFFHSFAILLAPSLISLLFCAAFSFPLFSLPTLILFFTTLGTTSTLIIPQNVKWQIYPAIRVFLALIVILFSSIAILPLQKILYYKIWNKASLMYSLGYYVDANMLYKKCLPALASNGLVLQLYGKSLQMADQNHEAIKTLERAGTLTIDQVLYITMGDACKVTKQYVKAESAYKQALCMEPNKLYPRYLLAILYDDSGQRLKAIETAKGLLNKDIKVQSNAIEEIKTEMKSILTKYDQQ